MAVKIRYCDGSGKLLQGCFFILAVPFDTDLDARTSSDSEKWIISDPQRRIDDNDLYAEVSVHSTLQYNCPLDRSHITGSNVTEVSWADVYGGDRVAAFIRDFIGQSVVVSEEFGDRLLQSGLKGLGTMFVPIRVNQSTLPNPQCQRLVFNGRRCLRGMQFQVPELNQCPRCHWGPVLCPRCHDITVRCPTCELELIAFGAANSNQPFVAEMLSDTNAVIETDKWDGSDFIEPNIITKRALDFLLSVHAAPFIAKPCWANVERLSKEEANALERKMALR